MLLAPNTEKPPARLPLNDMMRLGMDLVEKYKLGKRGEYNQSLAADDITAMEMAVHRIPAYPYDANQRLIADGVKLNDKQNQALLAALLSRLATRLGDELIAEDVTEMLSTRVRYEAHENWVTSDNELITLLDSYRRGGDPQKKTVRQKMLHIFLTVTQASAAQLLTRLSTPRKGDLVSDRFNSVFSPSIKADMLSALQIPR
jgi:hypothetical protein